MAFDHEKLKRELKKKYPDRIGELSRTLGFHSNYLYHLVCIRKDPHFDVVEKLADALGMKMENLRK